MTPPDPPLPAADLPTVELFRGRTRPHACSYLPEETSRLSFRLVTSLDEREYAALLARGWRRQGTSLFRAECPACTKCRGLRVDAAAFRPTKSQRRCLRKNAGVTVTVRPAAATAEHVDLYNRWHRDMHARRDWESDASTVREYRENLVGPGFPFAKEFAYRDESGALVGVGLVDEVPDGLNSIYFYYDPAWRPRSPGTFSALSEIDHARRTGRRWVYLGYWIPENASMAYKNRFAPHEVLRGRPAIGEEPVWREPGGGPAAN